MKEQTSEATGQITIRTFSEDPSEFVDITIVVRDKEIVSMSGVDEKGRGWEVDQIKFTGGEEGKENDECICCGPDGQGRTKCVACPCE
jgi:hypothetical protein